MGLVTPNISIYIPADGETNYGASFLQGMMNIDQHDHSGPPDGGVPISTSGIADGSVTYKKLAANVVDTTTGLGVTGAAGANQIATTGVLNSLNAAYGVGNGIPYINGTAVTPIAYAHTAFVPFLTIGGSSTGITYSSRLAEYVQIGNIVMFTFAINTTSLGGLTGTPVTINGFPVAWGGSTSQQFNFTQFSTGIAKAGATGFVGDFVSTGGNTAANIAVLSAASGVSAGIDDTYLSPTNNSLVALGFYFTT